MAMPLFTATAQGPGRGRGMPAEAREVIHGLFDSHDKFEREVKKTDDGYVSKTTSKDPAVVKLLQTHVKQMEKRLKQGLMVRRWDPAYEEFVNHYDDIDIKITNIENGISIKAVGATADAKKVARNHAGIISKFIQNGWNEHDKTHPAVVHTDVLDLEAKQHREGRGARRAKRHPPLRRLGIEQLVRVGTGRFEPAHVGSSSADRKNSMMCVRRRASAGSVSGLSSSSPSRNGASEK